MKMYAGVTDNAWYSFLAGQGSVDEVNFWHPGGKSPFARLPEGAPVLFKLKRPHHHIAGGGFFIKFTSLPLRLAWDVFGAKNGAATFREFEGLIMAARARHAAVFRIACRRAACRVRCPRAHDASARAGDVSCPGDQCVRETLRHHR